MSDRDVFTLSGGLNLSYLTWGEAGAPDLLLLHGGGLDATDWREVAPELAAAGYRVTAPDLRGCGESDWDPEAHYGVEDTLTDLDELLEHLGLESFVLVGHSLGRRHRVRLRGAASRAGRGVRDGGRRAGRPHPPLVAREPDDRLRVDRARPRRARQDAPARRFRPGCRSRGFARSTTGA